MKRVDTYDHSVQLSQPSLNFAPRVQQSNAYDPALGFVAGEIGKTSVALAKVEGLIGSTRMASGDRSGLT
jgi:hypothetical protein